MSRLYNILEAITEKFLPRDNMRSGSVAAETISANSYKDVSVTFDTPMATTPTVVLTLYSSSTSPNIGHVSVSLMTATKNGFSARIYNADTTSGRAPGLRWIAYVGGDTA